jgi:hypothetical protein
VLVFASLGLLSACANSDFGDVNPVLVTDGIHDWIGRDRSAKPVPPSKFEFTDRRYYNRLMSDWHRSPSSRYAQLIDDIRNDTTRLSQFFETAGRVMDIDQKRQKSLA